MRLVPWYVLLAFPIGACVSTNAALLDPTVKYQKICPDGVQIFTTAEHITNDYREVALLHSKGESGWTTERGMMASQREKAATLGANGILLNSIKEPNAGTKIIGAILGTGSERQGAAVAIYIPADSERVKQACGLAPQESAVASSRALIHGAGDAHAFVPAPEQAPAHQASPPAPLPSATQASKASQEAESPPAGYASYAASDPAPATAEPSWSASQPDATHPGGAGRFNGELRRFGSLRQALDDVVRSRIVTDYSEVRVGVLKVMLGSGYDGGAVEYSLQRLWSAYNETLDGTTRGVLELWTEGRKLGEYSSDGLLVGPAYSTPR
jgi:hypothetical protein